MKIITDKSICSYTSYILWFSTKRQIRVGFFHGGTWLVIRWDRLFFNTSWEWDLHIDSEAE